MTDFQIKIESRQRRFDLLSQHSKFDAVILGGGINGACVYDYFCRRGFRVLLLDKGDFASGTSQASAMMVWGGLLYLRNLDFSTVFKLCRERDRMIKEMPSRVNVQFLRYLPSGLKGRKKSFIHMALWFYWLLGLMRREPPRSESLFDEMTLLRDNFIRGSLLYEEAVLTESDARFVLRWITPHQNSGNSAFNYCHAQGEYNGHDRYWHLDINDRFTGKTYSTQSRLIINCTGVWADEVNRQHKIQSPVCHALSKGVFLIIKRSRLHKSLLVFDLGEYGDAITLIPWGPVSLWGPTETSVDNIEEGFEVTAQDTTYLWDHYHKRFSKSLSKQDVISFRCGIRPLVVPVGYHSDRYPLDLSRRQKIVVDREKPWISCYGGKVTGCQAMAQKVVRAASHWLPEPITQPALHQITPVWSSFPGIEEAIPAAAFCRDYEFCYTLDDYLRRRTNISQWVSHEGLGFNHENMPILKKIAAEINGGDLPSAEREVTAYAEAVDARRQKALSDISERRPPA
ncbi:MAG: FAD-dependent oxidoreductase [Syntrophaceae bacterium]